MVAADNGLMDRGALEVSRFSCMLFLSGRRFYDYAGPINPLARNVVVRVAFLLHYGVGVLSRDVSKLNSPAH
jgi:hypothetical protein